MNYAQAVCDSLDELDRTPFGDMGKALDKISDLAVKSAQRTVKLEALRHEAADYINELEASNMANVLFGKDQTDRAIKAEPKLAAARDALDGMVLVCGRTGASLEDFEEVAEAFHRETGFMRPGKDMPMGGGGEHDDDIRRDKFNAWVKSKIAAGRAALASLKED